MVVLSQSQIANLKSQNDNANLKSRDVKVRGYKLSLEVITLVNQLPNKRAFFIIGDQLIRSTTSICANMIEAQAASSRRDFIKFYEIALKSANETKYWIALLRDTCPELKLVCEELLKETTEIGNMIGSSVLTLKGKKNFKF